MITSTRVQKKTGKWRRLFIFFTVLFLGLIVAFGWWLPRYLILEEGISLENKPKAVFLCLLDSEIPMNTSEIRRGDLIKLNLDVFPKGVVSEFSEDDFVILTQNSDTSLTITLEDEGEFGWLSVIVEKDLGNNPLVRILENLGRSKKEQELVNFLSNFVSNKMPVCIKSEKRNLLIEKKET